MPAPPTNPDDIVIPFQAGPSSIRGRLVKLGRSINDILTPHAFPYALSQLLGETSALVAMLGSGLKIDGKLTMQMKGDGPVSMVVADYASSGALRATAMIRPGKGDQIDRARGPELHYLLQKGYMAITIDPGKNMDRYQGVVALEGARLSQAMLTYFDRSEQIPTRLFLAVGEIMGGEPEGTSWRAGGIMVQYVPGEGGEISHREIGADSPDPLSAWETICALMQTVKADELLDPDLTPEALLFRLFHEEGVRIFPQKPVHFACSCSREKIRVVLDQYDRPDLEDLVIDGKIEVSCDFCRKIYYFDPN